MSPFAPHQYRPSPASRERQAYIPAGMNKAMTQHMQQSLPSHLKKYATGNAGYVPDHVERQIVQHMQKTAPGHMKDYVGAFVQQNIVTPGLQHPAGSQPRAITPHAPIPDRLRLDHSNVPGEQHTVVFHNNLFAPDSERVVAVAPQTAGTAGQPQATQYPGQSQPVYPQSPGPQLQPPQGQYPGQQYGAPVPPGVPQNMPPQNQPPVPHTDYEFIVNPGAPPHRSRLPGGGSLLGRVIVIAIGLILLLTVFSVVKNLLNGNSNTPLLASVAQDQQAVIHLSANALTQKQNQVAFSTTNTNFAVTSQLGLTSQQAELLKYMKLNHKKVSPKTLNLKVSQATDTQLTAAAAASTYDQTFHDIMQAKLNTYLLDLKQAYNATKGQKGQQLLSKDYDAAQLLLTQLNTPASTP